MVKVILAHGNWRHWRFNFDSGACMPFRTCLRVFSGSLGTRLVGVPVYHRNASGQSRLRVHNLYCGEREEKAAVYNFLNRHKLFNSPAD